MIFYLTEVEKKIGYAFKDKSLMWERSKAEGEEGIRE